MAAGAPWGQTATGPRAREFYPEPLGNPVDSLGTSGANGVVGCLDGLLIKS